jgi:organic radical activating enzyme
MSSIDRPEDLHVDIPEEDQDDIPEEDQDDIQEAKKALVYLSPQMRKVLEDMKTDGKPIENVERFIEFRKKIRDCFNKIDALSIDDKINELSLLAQKFSNREEREQRVEEHHSLLVQCIVNEQTLIQEAIDLVKNVKIGTQETVVNINDCINKHNSHINHLLLNNVPNRPQPMPHIEQIISPQSSRMLKRSA